MGWPFDSFKKSSLDSQNTVAGVLAVTMCLPAVTVGVSSQCSGLLCHERPLRPWLLSNDGPLLWPHGTNCQSLLALVLTLSSAFLVLGATIFWIPQWVNIHHNLLPEQLSQILVCVHLWAYLLVEWFGCVRTGWYICLYHQTCSQFLVTAYCCFRKSAVCNTFRRLCSCTRFLQIRQSYV